VLDELTDAFVARGILVRATEPEGVMLSRPPEDLKVIDILEAIQNPSRDNAWTARTQASAVAEVLHQRDEAVRSAMSDVTLRSLASETDRPESTVADLTQYRRR
jgi:DNA-binding IscR family transcriptional regulator